MTKTMTKAKAERVNSALASIADPSVTVTLTNENACDAACQTNQHPTDAGCEESIRVLAHHKWEAAGCPAGDGFDFWLEAERQLNAERPTSSPAQG